MWRESKLHELMPGVRAADVGLSLRCGGRVECDAMLVVGAPGRIGRRLRSWFRLVPPSTDGWVMTLSGAQDPQGGADLVFTVVMCEDCARALTLLPEAAGDA